MKMDSVTIFIAVCFGLFGLYQLCDRIIVPMFNSYLQYKRDLRELDITKNNIDWWDKREQERLQRDNDESDSSERIGQSVKGTPIHDEELPL